MSKFKELKPFRVIRFIPERCTGIESAHQHANSITREDTHAYVIITVKSHKGLKLMTVFQ